MMRPMKLAGRQLLFGQGCLEHLTTLPHKRAIIVTGGKSMEKSGVLQTVTEYLQQAKMDVDYINGVEPDPSFKTVYSGALKMRQFQPDLIVALGGGSAMDAAKGMWVYYEHAQMNTLADILPPNKVPALRNKAELLCIPSTAGTASEVSRSIVITDETTHIKYGIGDMEMMPDIAICDPLVTSSMPPAITAETGLDAMTHSLEALVSNRANYISDILARQAIKDIYEYLPKAYHDGKNLDHREKMLNASMVAGMAFTNVSLGIVHSMAHTLGSYFGIAHGLADAILLPYIVEFNSQDPVAEQAYNTLAKELGCETMVELVLNLNEQLNIPSKLSEVISERELFLERLNEMAEMALNDGCTKTNPVIPSIEQFKNLFMTAFE